MASKLEDGMSWNKVPNKLSFISIKMLAVIFPLKQDIGFRIPLIKELSKRTNSEIILVAYRGYSDSEGFPT